MLARSGHDVTVTARGTGLEALQNGPLIMTGEWGESEVALNTVPALEDTQDLVILTTKAQDAAAAIQQNCDAIGTRPVIVIQNGLGAIDTATHALGRTDGVYAGSSSIGAAYLRADAVHVNVPGPTKVGSGHGAPPQQLAEIAAELNKSLPVIAVDNFVGVLWTKLMVNHINALPALTGMSIQAETANAELCLILTASMCETIRLAKHLGIRYEPMQGLDHEMLTGMLDIPISQAMAVPRTITAPMGSYPNRGSTLQSILRGQPTEVDWINGAVVAQATAAGRTAPIHELLVELVHRVEQTYPSIGTRAWFAPEELAAMFAPLVSAQAKLTI